jgi:hypothetical protein
MRIWNLQHDEDHLRTMAFYGGTHTHNKFKRKEKLPYLIERNIIGDSALLYVHPSMSMLS